MSDEIMNRTQKLENFINSMDWDDSVAYKHLDSVNSEKTDSNVLSVEENSGEAHYLSYRASNFMTFFLHQPEKAINNITNMFPEAARKALADDSIPTLSTETDRIEFKGDSVRVVSRQGLVPIASIINRVEGRKVEDRERYYVTPYIRLLRKNYGYFDAHYFKVAGKGLLVPGSKMSKVIYRENKGTSATDW